jgi:hypothetical protein
MGAQFVAWIECGLQKSSGPKTFVDLLEQRRVGAAPEFERVAGECRDCPSFGSQTLACTRYITFPIDEPFERLAFEYFVSELGTLDSTGDQLNEDVVAAVPSLGTDWHTKRGADEHPFAARAQPLVHSWSDGPYQRRVDSAQLLAALFATVSDPPLVMVYAAFWAGLVAHADRAHGGLGGSRTLGEARALVPFFEVMAHNALKRPSAVIVSCRDA